LGNTLPVRPQDVEKQYKKCLNYCRPALAKGQALLLGRHGAANVLERAVYFTA